MLRFSQLRPVFQEVDEFLTCRAPLILMTAILNYTGQNKEARETASRCEVGLQASVEILDTILTGPNTA